MKQPLINHNLERDLHIFRTQFRYLGCVVYLVKGETTRMGTLKYVFILPYMGMCAWMCIYIYIIVYTLLPLLTNKLFFLQEV
jgi:Na+-transporting NADH:ubiquinone oxidoreductase subunit NqrC